MNKELLLEIGTEEIPAAFLPQAMKDMEEMIRREFSALLIRHGEVRTFSTPRRLVLSVAELATRQDERIIEKLGPARRVAFDGQGNPTQAALGFARSQGVDVDSLETVVTDKGEYLALRRKIEGQATRSLLPIILPKFIASIPFRKTMRWADRELRFARPIHWLLALYGGDVVPFKLDDMESGNRSYGHRFMSPESFSVENLWDYLKKTREHFVIVNPEERKNLIVRQSEAAARSISGQVLYREELLETVTYLVEYPTVIMGDFDPEYLTLPKEVLTTTMMTHQKYFPLTDGDGKLLPNFLAVSNTLPRDTGIVKRGNEKVIRARLSDARFFFQEDQKIPLESRLEDLKGVVFHTLLGTSYEKVMRLRALAVEIALKLDPSIKERVFRVATLAKADLSTQMVGEFPELQGVMGREYALLAREDPRIAQGIYEHYLPLSAGGDLPGTDEGALVGVADKMDSIAGFFGVNLIPTGTADPYALRRQALGIINIILSRRYPLHLNWLIAKSLSILGGLLKRPAPEVEADCLAFFRSRFENQLISQGRAYDVVNAVLATDATDLVQAEKKINALETVRKDAEFEALAIAFKRIGNIIKGFHGGSADPRLFETEAEKTLFSAYGAIKERVEAFLSREDYLSGLREMALLRGPVDNFFDAVLVMAEDEKIRSNRLSLLEAISFLFHQLADFSRIVTSRENKAVT